MVAYWSLLDHPIRAQQHGRRHRQPQRLRCLHIDDALTATDADARGQRPDPRDRGGLLGTETESGLSARYSPPLPVPGEREPFEAAAR